MKAEDFCADIRATESHWLLWNNSSMAYFSGGGSFKIGLPKIQTMAALSLKEQDKNTWESVNIKRNQKMNGESEWKLRLLDKPRGGGTVWLEQLALITPVCLPEHMSWHPIRKVLFSRLLLLPTTTGRSNQLKSKNCTIIGTFSGKV